MKNNSKGLGLYVIIFMLIAMFVTLTGKVSPTENNYHYDNLMKDLNSDSINKLEIVSDTEVFGTGLARVYNDPTDPNKFVEVKIPEIGTFMEKVDDSILQDKVTIVDTKKAASTKWISDILIPIGFMVITVFILFYFIQQSQGRGGGGRDMNFGKSKAKLVTSDKNKVGFDDVAGLDEEKIELAEIVEFLKNPSKFTAIGARIPKGVLLVGPPGTGKTLLAKAVAGESKVPFFSISGSDFVEMYVGVGASRVRDMFVQAKKNTPCLIFIDEIDAVGRKRGSGHGGGHDEREQTLNQLLVEMDGFSANDGIIIIAATNRRDILDDALLRPGRFDREVVVGLPDVKAREEILEVHSQGKKMGPDVDLKVLARSTSGFTGADLENLLNEAALICARDGKQEIDMEGIRKAVIKIGVGTEKTGKIVTEKDKKITAYHEIGHAILQDIQTELNPVHVISIIPTGAAAGYMMNLSENDNNHMTKTKMQQEIIAILGGRAAEEIIFGEITTGASSDIGKATSIAKNMITRFGMNEKVGLLSLYSSEVDPYSGKAIRDYSEKLSAIIDDELKSAMDHFYSESKRILRENEDILHSGAALLISKDKITGVEFRRLFGEGRLPFKEHSKGLLEDTENNL